VSGRRWQRLILRNGVGGETSAADLAATGAQADEQLLLCVPAVLHSPDVSPHVLFCTALNGSRAELLQSV
jgi:hypothetical protein